MGLARKSKLVVRDGHILFTADVKQRIGCPVRAASSLHRQIGERGRTHWRNLLADCQPLFLEPMADKEFREVNQTA
jgi:hypothetical protein